MKATKAGQVVQTALWSVAATALVLLFLALALLLGWIPVAVAALLFGDRVAGLLAGSTLVVAALGAVGLVAAIGAKLAARCRDHRGGRRPQQEGRRP